MSPGGLGKPTTILLEQQDADGIGDVSSMCSVRQKNTMRNNTRITCVLADWPSPRPGVNCYNNSRKQMV